MLRHNVVIDVGAARHGDDYSMERLIDSYEPTDLYAVDPHPNLSMPTNADLTRVELIHAAAWYFDGEIGYKEDGLRSKLSWKRKDKVPCIDLARLINDVAARHPSANIILKLDVEGSEYVLLEHIYTESADENLVLILVEWHKRNGGSRKKKEYKSILNCKLEEWPY